MRYNTELNENNAELQTILDTVNALPEAGSGGNKEDVLIYATCANNMFDNAVFPEDYTLSLNLPRITSLNYFAMRSNVKKVILKGNENKNSISTAYAFFNCTNLEEVDFSDFNMVFREGTYAFSTCKSLKKLTGEFDFSKCVKIGNTFISSSNNLEEIRIKKETLSLSLELPSAFLSDLSIQSIIDGLADLTGGTAQTLTLHADVKAKLTEEQISTITGKNWTLA